jgi:uncharacterized protein (TIGR02284 family)
MRMSHKFTIEALRELLAARRDSEQALRSCAESVRTEPLRSICAGAAAESGLAVRELEALIERLGAQPHGRAASSHAWRSGWASLRAALACDDPGAILDACEHGESRTLEAYRNALDDPLPEFVRELVLRQFEGVMSTHEAIRECRSARPLRGELARPGAQADQH